jgi:hypothetical protein
MTPTWSCWLRVARLERREVGLEGRQPRHRHPRRARGVPERGRLRSLSIMGAATLTAGSPCHCCTGRRYIPLAPMAYSRRHPARTFASIVSAGLRRRSVKRPRRRRGREGRAEPLPAEGGLGEPGAGECVVLLGAHGVVEEGGGVDDGRVSPLKPPDGGSECPHPRDVLPAMAAELVGAPPAEALEPRRLEAVERGSDRSEGDVDILAIDTHPRVSAPHCGPGLKDRRRAYRSIPAPRVCGAMPYERGGGGDQLGEQADPDGASKRGSCASCPQACCGTGT